MVYGEVPPFAVTNRGAACNDKSMFFIPSSHNKYIGFVGLDDRQIRALVESLLQSTPLRPLIGREILHFLSVWEFHKHG